MVMMFPLFVVLLIRLQYTVEVEMYNPFKQKESPLLGGRKTETLLCQPIPQQEYRWPGRSNNKTPTKIIVCWVTPDVHWLVRCMVLYRGKEKVLNHSV